MFQCETSSLRDKAKVKSKKAKLRNGNRWVLFPLPAAPTRFPLRIFCLSPFAFLLACVAGCMSVGPNYHPIETKMPEGFAATASWQEQKPAQPVIDAANWWKSLNDQELDSLIDRAVQSNPSIEIALNRMQQARMKEALIFGQAMPVAGESAGGGSGTGSDLSRGRADTVMYSADNSTITETVPTTKKVKNKKTGKTTIEHGTKTITKKFSQISSVYGFDGGWDLDLFGRYRRALEAAAYDTQAAIAVRNTVLISVIADVVRAYMDMRAFQMQLAVLERGIYVAQTYVDFTRDRFEHGITNELDVALAQRQLATLQAQKAPLIAQIQASQYAIAVLIGTFPEDLVKELEKPGPIPQLPEKIGAGLPVDLLRTRPDIENAERQVASAIAQIGVAEASLFPRVVLLGAVGNEAQGFPVPNMAAFIWSAGPSINWALLDFGTLDSLVEIADLHARELLINYKLTVLNAVREADTAIGAYASQQDRLKNLDNAVAAARRAVDLATQRYDRGLTDSLNVIDAERQEYEIEAAYVAAQQAASQYFIGFYRSLGTGWEQYQTFPPVRRPQPAVIAAFTRLLTPTESEKVLKVSDQGPMSH